MNGGIMEPVYWKNFLKRKIENIFFENKNFEKQIDVIDYDTIIAKKEVSLHSLAKIINIDFSHHTGYTLEEFLLKKIGEFPTYEKRIVFEFNGYYFELEDKKTSRIRIRRKQVLNGKPLFYR